MAHTQQKWNAEDYAKHSSAQLQWAKELIAKLNPKGNESILDIGCGDGKISALLAQAVPHGSVVGIDLSEDMIRLAKETFPPASFPNLSFIRMDAAGIRLPQRFDLAFSNAVLHWVPDHPAVLRGLRACLNPGSRILLQMGGRGNAADVFDAMAAVMRRPFWSEFFHAFTPPYHFYGPEAYRPWLEETGFRTVRIELIPKDMQYTDAEGFMGWLRTTWFPYTNCLPADRRDAFLVEVANAYTQAHPLDAAGHTHVGMVRLEVEACVRCSDRTNQEINNGQID